MTGLTARQRQILLFLVDSRNKRGFPPSIREIQHVFGFSPNGVLCHLKALEKKGVIKREPDKARGITILRDPTGWAGFVHRLPFRGKVA